MQALSVVVLCLLVSSPLFAQDAAEKQVVAPPAPQPAAPPPSSAPDAPKPPPKPPGDLAKAAYDRGDYRAAFDAWLPRARKGEAIAQRELAKLYFYGQGTPKEVAEAFRWANLAGRQSDPEAQYYVGLMYEEGLGVMRDYLTAARWYVQAAQKNEPRAQQRLGKLYMQGQGVPQDIQKARFWLQQASTQGNSQSAYQMGWLLAQQGLYPRAMEYFLQAAQDNHSKAMGNLGWIFERGKGTRQDLVQAYVWYTLAERYAENPDAAIVADKDRLRVRKLMTDVQREEAEKLLTNWQ